MPKLNIKGYSLKKWTRIRYTNIKRTRTESKRIHRKFLIKKKKLKQLHKKIPNTKNHNMNSLETDCVSVFPKDDLYNLELQNVNQSTIKIQFFNLRTEDQVFTVASSFT